MITQKVKLPEIFLEWFKQTNPHLYMKGITKNEREAELEEYVSDVLHEHMELMENSFNDDDFDDGFKDGDEN